MTKSPSKFIAFRPEPELRARFDAALKFKGWKVQEALTRIVTGFVESVEREMGTADPWTGPHQEGWVNPRETPAAPQPEPPRPRKPRQSR